MSQVNEIKSAVNIVDVINEKLDLKRAGSNYKALCPFHSESTPSFFVNEQLQRYKCFGCGASGDVIQFLEQYDGMSFLEALQELADRAGIKLKKYHRSQEDDQRDKLLELLDLARKYYHWLLTDHKLANEPRDYLKQRKIHQESIKLFQLGYALPAWDGLLNFLTKKKKYKPQEVVAAGLALKSKTGRFYDRFRDRIVFPLRNHRGQVVGFSGRALSSDEKTPKYINTPETQLYHKAQTLFGYSELYQDIRQKKQVLVCEGEFDVISSYQAHVKHIVAIKGSALTEQQAKLLDRTVDKVLLCLDTDPAGVKATKRAINVIQGTDLDLRVVDLSRVKTDFVVKDADDLARQDPKLWRETVKQSVSVYDFLISVSFEKFKADTAEGKRQIVDDLAPVISQIPHEVEKDFYLNKLSEKLHVNKGSLALDIERFGQKPRSQQRSKSKDEPVSKVDPQTHLEEYLLFLLFQFEADQIQDRAKELLGFDLNITGADQILKQLSSLEEKFGLQQFSRQLGEDLQANLMEWTQQPEFLSLVGQIEVEIEWQRALAKLRRKQIRIEIEAINQGIAKLEKKSDKTEAEQQQLETFLKRIAQLHVKLKEL